MIDRLPLARHRWEWQKQGRAISCRAAGTATVSPCWAFLIFPHFLPLKGLKFWHKGNSDTPKTKVSTSQCRLDFALTSFERPRLPVLCSGKGQHLCVPIDWEGKSKQREPFPNGNAADASD